MLLLFSCAPRVITRARWQQMSPADRTIYVSALIGEEKARQQKGGSGRDYSEAPEHYVTRIDAAYARGDQRDVHTIFQEMADPK